MPSPLVVPDQCCAPFILRSILCWVELHAMFNVFTNKMFIMVHGYQVHALKLSSSFDPKEICGFFPLFFLERILTDDEIVPNI